MPMIAATTHSGLCFHRPEGSSTSSADLCFSLFLHPVVAFLALPYCRDLALFALHCAVLILPQRNRDLCGPMHRTQHGQKQTIRRNDYVSYKVYAILLYVCLDIGFCRITCVFLHDTACWHRQHQQACEHNAQDDPNNTVSPSFCATFCMQREGFAQIKYCCCLYGTIHPPMRCLVHAPTESPQTI